MNISGNEFIAVHKRVSNLRKIEVERVKGIFWNFTAFLEVYCDFGISARRNHTRLIVLHLFPS